MKANSFNAKRIDFNLYAKHRGILIRGPLWAMLVYICCILIAGIPSPACGAVDPLTPEERAWLNQHDGKIIVNNEAGWPPIIDMDKDGNSFGIAMDYQRLIEKKLNFNFKLDKLDSWDNFMERFRKGEIDVNNNLQKTPGRTEFALFTKPYIEIPNAIIVRKELEGSLTLEKMRGMKIAVTKEFAIHDYIKSNYKYLQLVPFEDELHCLLETSTKSVDAAVVNLAVASFVIEKMGIANLRVAGYAEYNNALCFATRKDWPILNQILEKGLNLITPAEREAIFRKWISLGYMPFYKSRIFWIVTCSATTVFSAFAVLIIWWNRSLRRQVQLRTEKLETTNIQLKGEIDERKKAEEALRESEEKFRTLVEKSPFAISLLTKNGHYKYINPQFTSIFGYTIEDIPTGADWFNKSFPDQDYRRKVIDAWIEDRNLISIGQSRPRIFSVTTKDGTQKEILFRPVTMENLDQFVIYEDITKKSKMEHQLQQIQKFEAIATLAGGIAHDFNNLLMGIQGRTSLMSLELDSSHPQMEHFNAIEDYIRSAVNLTNQLLGLARGGKYEVKPVDLNELVLKSAAMFGRTRKEIKIHTQVQPSLLVVEADQRQIEQVLLNMYINAWQAMPDGGELHLETRTVMVDDDHFGLHDAKPGPYAKVSVTDTGIGMNDSTRRHVFDPFFTTKEKSRGAGLGLASAYGIINNHGGIITVYSEVGQGATFNIYLPLSGEKIQHDPPLAERLIKGCETVLLVDDENMIIEVGHAMLERLGYRVVVSNGGEQAIEIISDMEFKIDLVILDLIMPGMDGGQTFDRIREIRANLPVILSSGYSINGKANDIMQRGCNGFIQKPFNLSELSQKIRKVLDASKSST